MSVARELLEQLLDAIAAIKSQDRAGITPPHGEVEAMFDVADDVRVALNRGAFDNQLAVQTVAVGEPATTTAAAHTPASEAALPEKAGVARLILELPTAVFRVA